MNKPVEISTAKLLKEKGLKLNFCRELFYENHVKGEFVRIEMIHDWKLIEDRDWYSAPTIAEVVMWLYEKCGVWIWVEINGVVKTFDYIIHNLNTIGSSHNIEKYNFKSPTEAYESAIEYSLKNLINEDNFKI